MLEIFDPESPDEALGEYELHNTPIHHPEGRDISLLHLKDEEDGKQRHSYFGGLRRPELIDGSTANIKYPCRSPP